MNRSNETLTFKGFSLRLLFALLLVYLSYNPSGYSYAHWVLNSISPLNLTPVLAICGLILAIGWAMYIRATLRSLGGLGLALAILLFGCIVWLFVDLGWLSIASVSIFAWVALFLMSLVLAIGMSWSHVRRRLSGQVDTDDVDD